MLSRLRGRGRGMGFSMARPSYAWPVSAHRVRAVLEKPGESPAAPCLLRARLEREQAVRSMRPELVRPIMRTPLFLIFATLAAAATSACGTASDYGPTGGATAGFPPATTAKSDFPIGSLSVCGTNVWLGETQGSYGGGATITLTEESGVVSAELNGGDGMILTGTVKFQVGTPTTAFALPDQSFVAEQVSGTPTTVSSGSLALVDGNVVLSIASATGVGQAWFQCEVPYAACDVPAADPGATLPSATYGNCVPQDGVDPGTVTVTRTGGTVTATFSNAIPFGTNDPLSSLDFTVVAAGTAITPPAAGAPRTTCGEGGLNGTLMVDGDFLFLSAGEDWEVGAFICTKAGS
jgi:hypothetical protein